MSTQVQCFRTVSFFAMALVTFGYGPLHAQPYALYLDGVDDFAFGSALAKKPSTELTIMSWIKADQFRDHTFIFSSGGRGREGFYLSIYRGGGRIVAGIAGLENYSYPGEFWAGFPFLPSTWYHLAVTYDGERVSFYVDAQLVHQIETTGVVTEAHGNIFIGQYVNGRYRVGGIVDDVRIWDRALAPEEIEQQRMGPAAADDPGLIAAWDFSEGTGQLARDSSGLENHLTLGCDPEPDECDPSWAVAEHGFAEFLRGEVDGDGQRTISDPIAILNFLFRGGTVGACGDAADVNDDGVVDISDAVGELSFLFLGGIRPPAPYAECGLDPTPDFTHCQSYFLCE